MTPDSNEALLRKLHVALREVTLCLPYLSGLAARVRVTLDDRIDTAGVFPSGHVIIGHSFATELEIADLAFVIAHELLHLALRTHERASRTDARLFNIAHDYIINDMLLAALHRAAPAQGLLMPGARLLSAEKIVADLKASARSSMARPGFRTYAGPPRPVADSSLGTALRGAGLLGDEKREDPEGASDGDLLSAEEELRLFPDADTSDLDRRTTEMAKAAARAVELAAVMAAAEACFGKGMGDDPGAGSQWVATLAQDHCPPWEMAVQHWMDAVSRGERTFSRASRRDGGRTDIVIPGRRREGWRLHVVLDTSGSMWDEFPRILGAVARFCDATRVENIRVLQCDVGVSVDEVLTPTDLQTYEVRGGGGSDLRPAMARLAEDSEVEAVVVLTDGIVVIPEMRPPYEVLWGRVGEWADFRPPYGSVVPIPPSSGA